MRLRVLLPLMVAATIAVIALVLPIGSALAANRTQQLMLSRSAAMDHIVQLAELGLDTDDTSALERYLQVFDAVYGESAAVVDTTGNVVSSTTGMNVSSDTFTRLAASAPRNLPEMTVDTLTAWSPSSTLIAAPILTSGETSTGAVILRVDLTQARADVRASWFAVIIVGAALLAVLAVAALRWTRWVLRPVDVLDRAATGFPARPIAPEDVTGPPELQHLATSFSRMAEGVERTMTQQREFVADASHQLRNPLAAIRLRIDGLQLDAPAHAPELDAVSADLDRLEGTVSRMLDLATAEHRATARASGSTEGVPTGSRSHTIPNADALVEPFRELMRDAGQTLVTVGTEEVTVGCPRSDLEEIIGTLLDNARKYAGHDATVRVELARRGAVVDVIVSDDGPGLTDDELAVAATRFWRSPRHSEAAGTGLGLAIVHQLARANDGHVRLDHDDSGGLRVTVSFGVAL